ncbi:hypothetical protein BT93_D0722 [Corymbia citriodora subsp. variegata]|nr:hypothetical protein BT93_D0722 [Corymbia citriodora subsp. variegata]
MGASRKNKGVVKLVHPGRFVETLREPITAAEVMQKNPRHSVTRPDVFYFPWIVVKPESLLTPGEVFFIVPNRTIHQLLKGKSSHCCMPSSQQRDCPRDQDHQQFELASPIKECAGMTPKHRNQQSLPKKVFQTLYRRKSYHDKDLKMESTVRYRTESRTEEIPQYEDDQKESERLSPGDSTLERKSFSKKVSQTMYRRKLYHDEDLKTKSHSRDRTESRTEEIPQYEDDQKESERLSPGDSTLEIKSLSKRLSQTTYRRKWYHDEDLKTESHSRYRTEPRTEGIPQYVSPGDSTFEMTCSKAVDFYLGSRNMSTELLEKDAAVELICQKYGTVLKSCLRKPDSARRSLNLKVAFILPNRDEEADASDSCAESTGHLVD